jgi:hypothetical protein
MTDVHLIGVGATRWVALEFRVPLSGGPASDIWLLATRYDLRFYESAFNRFRLIAWLPDGQHEAMLEMRMAMMKSIGRLSSSGFRFMDNGLPILAPPLLRARHA